MTPQRPLGGTDQLHDGYSPKDKRRCRSRIRRIPWSGCASFLCTPGISPTGPGGMGWGSRGRLPGNVHSGCRGIPGGKQDGCPLLLGIIHL